MLYECDECEDGYYFSVFTKICQKNEDNFKIVKFHYMVKVNVENIKKLLFKQN